eukprot:8390-Pelagococcus_subviridis.AAC.2
MRSSPNARDDSADDVNIAHGAGVVATATATRTAQTTRGLDGARIDPGKVATVGVSSSPATVGVSSSPGSPPGASGATARSHNARASVRGVLPSTSNNVGGSAIARSSSSSPCIVAMANESMTPSRFSRVLACTRRPGPALRP